jgi:hypothetical protein
MAASVSADLSGFRFEGIEVHSQGTQTHYVAFFNREGARFALILGGEAMLGYDQDHPWVPGKDELECWEQFRHEYGEPLPPVEAFIRNYLTPLRRVRIEPFLLGVEATPVGEKPLDPGDPLFRRDVADELIPGVGGMMQLHHGRHIHYRLDEQGILHAAESIKVTHADVLEQVTSTGLRLPSSDEWEYACAAGSRTLFRWGDHIPSILEHPDPYPLAGRDLWELRTDPALLEEYVRYNREEPLCQPSHNPSLALNAFGIRFPPAYSGDAEFCREPDLLRGGGCVELLDLYDNVSTWLPTASSFFYRRPAYPGSDVAIRRACSLAMG